MGVICAQVLAVVLVVPRFHSAPLTLCPRFRMPHQPGKGSRFSLSGISRQIGAARLWFSQLPSGRKSSAIVCSIEYGDCLGNVVSSIPVSFAASSRALR